MYIFIYSRENLSTLELIGAAVLNILKFFLNITSEARCLKVLSPSARQHTVRLVTKPWLSAKTDMFNISVKITY